MQKLKLFHFEAIEADYIERAKDISKDSSVFLNIPLNGAWGHCLDHVPVPADVSLVQHALITAHIESPYDVALWARKYEDSRVVFDIIAQEEIAHYEDRAKREQAERS